MSDKSNDGKGDDNSESHEFADRDIYGEWIARDIANKAHQDVEHFKHAHSTDPIDGIMNSIFGTGEECLNPRCRSEEQHAEFEAEQEAARQSESWWERWSRTREENRFLADLDAENDSESSESWWEGLFRGSDSGGDGEGGSD